MSSMTLRAVAIIGGCAAAQLSLGAWLAVAWWLPDLVLIGMIVASAEPPRAPSPDVFLLGGVIVMAVTVPSERWPGLAYPIAGWLATRLGDRLELPASAKLQVSVGVGEAALLLMRMGLGAPSHPALAGWSLVRLLSTVACAPAIRRLIASRRITPHSA